MDAETEVAKALANDVTDQCGDQETTNWFGYFGKLSREDADYIIRENQFGTGSEESEFLADLVNEFLIVELTSQGFGYIVGFPDQDAALDEWEKICASVNEDLHEGDEDDESSE